MLFRKIKFFQKMTKKVDAAQKYLVPKNTSSENVFILNSFSIKKVGVPKITYPKELPILMKWLLRKRFAPKK